MKEGKLSQSLKFKTPTEINKAVHDGELSQTMLSMGCFWGPDANFGSLDGVIQTRVGYAGSPYPNPTYKNIKGHAETIRIYFDKNKIDYKSLIGSFESWRFFGKKEGQYRPIFYIFDEEQKNTIEEVSHLLGEDQMPSVFSFNQPECFFWPAEEYHQKYKLRKNPNFVSLAEQEYGPDWDQHLFFTKLNGIGKKGFDSSYWLNQLSKELQSTFRLG